MYAHRMHLCIINACTSSVLLMVMVVGVFGISLSRPEFCLWPFTGCFHCVCSISTWTSLYYFSSIFPVVVVFKEMSKNFLSNSENKKTTTQ